MNLGKGPKDPYLHFAQPTKHLLLYLSSRSGIAKIDPYQIHLHTHNYIRTHKMIHIKNTLESAQIK